MSWASSGETSSDTQPSTPLVWSWIGRNRSAACLRSSNRQLEEQRLARLAFLQFLADGVVVVVTVLDGVVEDRGIRGEPRDREILNVARSVPLVSSPRVMLSSQRLWPISWSFWVAFMISLLVRQTRSPRQWNGRTVRPQMLANSPKYSWSSA